MPRTGLSQEELRITVLDATESTIRRFGIEKTRLVDVAKSVGVNHAMLYRIFADKDALMDAVSERWLDHIDMALETITNSKKTPRVKLKQWFLTLHNLKRQKVLNDPELYSAFNYSAAKAKPFVKKHLQTTTQQLVSIIKAGMQLGEWQTNSPEILAQTLFTATLMFHHPQLVLENAAQVQTARLEGLLELLLTGMAYKK